MVKSFSNLILAVGIISIILVVLFFGYFYYITIPQKGDLKVFPKVVVPSVESKVLEHELKSMVKQDGIPVMVDEFELGKKNPFF